MESSSTTLETTGSRLGFLEPSDYDRAREVLESAGYDEKTLRELFGASPSFIPTPAQQARLLYCTRGLTRLETLVRTFLLDSAVSPADLAEALRPMDLQTWVDAGIVSITSAGAAAQVRLVPVRGLLMACDWVSQVRSVGRSDFVMGVAKSTELLASTIIQRPVDRALDLGTGCGLLGLLCSRHSNHVYATDKNPRATMFAEFNARLNQRHNVTCLSGDLLEPVAGQRFGQIICNPPYVISPDARYIFCESGMRGDHFCRSLVQTLPQHLEEGAFCHMLCNWATSGGQTWQEAIEPWFEGIGCDVLVFGGDTDDATRYVATWIADIQARTQETIPQYYERWVRYLESEKIEAVTYGVLVLRRRSGGSNWVRTDQAPSEMSPSCGAEILQRFELEDFLLQRSDDELLAEPFAAAAGLRMAQEYEVEAEALRLVETRLRMPRGIIFSTVADPQVTSLLTRCDGKRPLAAVFQEIAAALQLDVQQLIPGGLDLVRRLVQRGWLLPQASSTRAIERPLSHGGDAGC